MGIEPASSTIPAGTSATLAVRGLTPQTSSYNITFASSDPSTVWVQSAVNVAARASSVTFEIRGRRPGGPETITATLPNSLGGASTSATVSVGSARYLIPSVAHNKGLAGSQWYSDIAAANPSPFSVSVKLDYRPRGGGASITRFATLTSDTTVEWVNVLESVFGLSASEESQGVVSIVASMPLVISSRTYNRSSSGTFGQSYPAVTVADGTTKGKLVYLAGLKKTADFRTNIGMLNLGETACSMRFRFYGPNAEELGDTTLTADPHVWEAQSDVFKTLNISNQEVAWATAEVTTLNGLAWAYASVIDNRTNDPTTIPAVPVRSADRLLVPSVAHNKGYLGSRWYSDVALVNPGLTPTPVTLEFRPRGGGAPAQRTYTLPSKASVEWTNILESLFGLAAEQEAQGIVEIDSSLSLVVVSRTYNRSPQGTFGQSYPGLSGGESMSRGEKWALPQLRKSADYRTNIGIVNLGSAACTVRFRFYGESGSLIGEQLMIADPATWEPLSDIFKLTGAGDQPVAYALVDITLGNGPVWPYASVIDGNTNDPTTIAPLQYP